MEKKINRKDNLLKQYKDDNNLNARLNLHSYNENEIDWNEFCFDTMNIADYSEILELGCGNGVLWEKNKERIKDNCNIVLSDFFSGMLECAQNKLREIKDKFKFRVIDIESIPYPDNSFDVVIARHMLYHVPNIDKALSEIKRVLKPDGVFYATTNGENHLLQLAELVEEFDSEIEYSPKSYAEKFGLENGQKILENYFKNISREDFNGKIVVSISDPIVQYILSTRGNAEEILVGDKLNKFQSYIENILQEKEHIEIETSACIFKANI